MSYDNEDLDFGFDEDEDWDEDTSLDEFDLDLDDEDDEEGEYGDNRRDKKGPIPRKYVTEIVKRERDRERKKFQKVADEFAKIYGMPPDKAIEFAKQQMANQQAPPTTPPPGSPPPGSPPPGSPQILPPNQPLTPEQLQAAVGYIAQRQFQADEERKREQEARDFTMHYPDVEFKDIPQEVFELRKRRGLTLREAYVIHMASQREQDAARKGAEGALLNAERRKRKRTEGADYGGSADDTLTTLTDEERQIARQYGFTPKKYAELKRKVKAFKEGM